LGGKKGVQTGREGDPSPHHVGLRIRLGRRKDSKTSNTQKRSTSSGREKGEKKKPTVNLRQTKTGRQSSAKRVTQYELKNEKIGDRSPSTRYHLEHNWVLCIKHTITTTRPGVSRVKKSKRHGIGQKKRGKNKKGNSGRAHKRKQNGVENGEKKGRGIYKGDSFKGH